MLIVSGLDSVPHIFICFQKGTITLRENNLRYCVLKKTFQLN